MADTVQFLQTLHGAVTAYAEWERAADDAERAEKFYVADALAVPREQAKWAEAQATLRLAEHARRLEMAAREWLKQLADEDDSPEVPHG